MNRRGMTLIEVVIGAAVLTVAMAATYMLLFSSSKLTHSEIALRDARFQLNLRLDEISAEVRESSQALVRVQDFTDNAFPDPNQSLIVVLSARDAAGVFQRSSGLPVWQGMIVYAPYYDPALRSAQLRRYEVVPAPVEFQDEVASPVLSVDATNLTLGGTTIPRSDGRAVVSRIDFFRADLNANSVRVQLSIGADPVAGTSAVELESEVKGRN